MISVPFSVEILSRIHPIQIEYSDLVRNSPFGPDSRSVECDNRFNYSLTSLRGFVPARRQFKRCHDSGTPLKADP